MVVVVVVVVVVGMMVSWLRIDGAVGGLLMRGLDLNVGLSF